jgi:hypothetical protein
MGKSKAGTVVVPQTTFDLRWDKLGALSSVRVDTHIPSGHMLAIRKDGTIRRWPEVLRGLFLMLAETMRAELVRDKKLTKPKGEQK